MCRPYHFLLPLLSIFLVRVDLTDLWRLRISVKSVEVLDGDTVQVSRGGGRHRVRLRFIDAPEKGQRSVSLDLGEYSRNCLKEMIKGPKVLSVFGFDRYHRILGEIDDLSYRMVLRGCAYLYDYAHFDDRAQRTKFLLAQNEAQKRRRGLWKFKVLNPRLYRQSPVKNTLTN